MKAIVVYESMFGNTHRVAEAIAEGVRQVGEAEIVRVTDVEPADLESADLIVVGGPTHVHGMSMPASRKDAVRMAGARDSGLALEPLGADIGVREWLESNPMVPNLYAAFDTRADAMKWFTGSAATHIAKKLSRHDRIRVSEDGSFLAPDNDIALSEIDRAREWGATVGRNALEAIGIAHR